jgi:hypothetical protein
MKSCELYFQHYFVGLLCIYSHDGKSRSELSFSSDSLCGVLVVSVFIWDCLIHLKPSPIVLRKSKTGLRFVLSRQMFGEMGFLLLYVV